MKKLIGAVLTVLLLAGAISAIAAGVYYTTNKYEGQTETELTPPESYDYSIAMDLVGKVEYPSPEAEAVVEVAKAYLLRGHNIQYDDKRLVRITESRWQTLVNSPEDCTSQHTAYTSCSLFTNDVFYQALGIEIGTTRAADQARRKDLQVFSVTTADVTTDAQKAKLQQEFYDTLQPGDLIALARTSASGHTMIYIGNGLCIHATGASYSEEQNRDNEERYGSVRYYDTSLFFTEGEYYDLWGVEVFSILRPMKVYGGKITEETKARLANMRDIYAEKLCTYTEGQTVDINQEITYTFFLHNYGKTDRTLDIYDSVPTGTEYVKGAQNIKGVIMSWTVTVPAGKSIAVSYTVKVKNDDSLYGSEIYSTSTVGGVDVNARKIYVGKNLTTAEQNNILSALKSFEGSEITGIKLANMVYEKAGLSFNLPEETALLDNLLPYAGKDFYTINLSSDYIEMVAPGLYGGFNLKDNSSYPYTRTRDLYTYHLMVGDLIITEEDGKTFVYMYAGEGQVFDMCPRVSEMLSPYSSELAVMAGVGSDRYVVLRPSLNRARTLKMPVIRNYPISPEGEVEYSSDAIEALIVTAKAFVAKTTATQYEDSYFTATGERWFETFEHTFEEVSSQIHYSSSCSPFMKDLVWDAWGVDMTEPDVWTAAQMAKAKKYSYWSYVPTKNETAAEKEKIKNEFFDTLQPGDMIALCHQGPQGHIFLYIGNHWAIHCSWVKVGGNYDHANNEMKWEIDGSVEYRNLDTIFNEGNYYYFWGKEIWSILRMTEYIDNIQITEQAKLRVANLQNIYVEKISSNPTGITADLGEEITFGFCVRNDDSKERTLEIKDTVPNGTTYLSGAQAKNGKEMSWNITLQPGEKRLICYTVKVNNDKSLYGKPIHSESTVGGVFVNCPDIYVAKGLSKNQEKLIYEKCRSLDTLIKESPLTVAEKIYGVAGISVDLPGENTLVDSIFAGTKNYYRLNSLSKYYSIVAPTLYGGYRTHGEDAGKGDRTRNFQYNLMIGDILICSENGVFCYMYAGDSQLVDLNNHTLLSISDSKDVMSSVFGHDMWCVVRPAMAQ